MLSITIKLTLFAIFLGVLAFIGLALYIGAPLAWGAVRAWAPKWWGRQTSSAKDRVKKRVGLWFLMFLVAGSANATLATSQEVIGAHKNWTPVANPPPVVVKMSSEYAAPTATPTPTFTWNATTTLTQPPTATWTPTSTPVYVRVDTNEVTFSMLPTRVYQQVVPAGTPVTITFTAPDTGYHRLVNPHLKNVGVVPVTVQSIVGGYSKYFYLEPYSVLKEPIIGGSAAAVSVIVTGAAGATIMGSCNTAIVKD